MRTKLAFFPLALLIISAIDSNRNLPSTALFGSSLIFYFLFSAVFFLFPTALVSAELSSTHYDKGGIYHWVRDAFGEKWGMIAIWLQWINTVVWFPTILSFIAGALAFVINPSFLEDKTYMIVSIAVIFWGLTILNLFGLHVSAKVNSILAMIGTLFPMCMLIALGIYWYYSGKSIQVPLTFSAIVPKLEHLDSWAALVAVIGSFLGMELSGVHVRHVQNPRKLFPRALGVATVVILATMLLGALTIAVILPVEKINLAGGIMQVFDEVFSLFGLSFLIPVMTVLIILGSVGGLINWMISPSKGLLFAAEHGFLPLYFTKLNMKGVASRVLIVQALIVSLLCGLLLFVPTVNAFYWFLTALSTGLYMLMYLLMFLAAIKLRDKKKSFHKDKFTIPGGKFGLWTTCLFGIFGAFLTFFVGFVPPPNIEVGSGLRYTLMIAGGNLLFILPVFFTFLYKKNQK